MSAALGGGRLVMEGIGSADAGRRSPAHNNMRSLDFACPEDVEGLGMTMGRTRSLSEPDLNIRCLTTISYKAAFRITILFL
jgi:hypothetical protein